MDTDTTSKVKQHDYVTIDSYRGIVFFVDGPATETVPSIGLWEDEDGVECEYEDWDDPETIEVAGRWRTHMVGDDRTFEFDEDEMTPLPDDESVCSCGQLGCGWG